MKKTILSVGFLLTVSVSGAMAQGVREIPNSTQPQRTSTTAAESAQTTTPAARAPQSFAAKYEGGLFGFSEKVKGTLNFDDVNKRLVFRNKENKEVFSLPYKSLLVVSPGSSSYRPTGATVASAIPVPGAGLLGLIRSKHRYLIVQFDDPDSKVTGTMSFKVEDKNLLQSVIQTLGQKAELKQRGDAFYRPRPESAQTL